MIYTVLAIHTHWQTDYIAQEKTEWANHWTFSMKFWTFLNLALLCINYMVENLIQESEQLWTDLLNYVFNNADT